MSECSDIDSLQNIDNQYLKSIKRIILDIRQKLVNMEKINNRMLHDVTVRTVNYSDDILEIKQELERANDIISSVGGELYLIIYNLLH